MILDDFHLHDLLPYNGMHTRHSQTPPMKSSVRSDRKNDKTVKGNIHIANGPLVANKELKV